MRRFGTEYVDFKHKRLEYFQRKLPDLSTSKGQIVSVSEASMKAVEASDNASLSQNKALSLIELESLLPTASKDMETE